MFNLYEILRSAHGGQALENLASQFHITPEEADAAVKAIVPELSDGFFKQASEPVAFGSFLGSLGQGHYLEAFADPAAAQASAQKGSDYLSEILGSSGAKEAIVQRASSTTGISQDTLSRMLPVIASMIFGGLAKSMQNQGFGSLLGQLSNAVSQGSLGPILSHILEGGPAPASPEPQPAGQPGPMAGAGGLGGILGAILGSLRQLTGAGPEAEPAAPRAPPPMAGFDAASIQEGLEALRKLLHPGTPPAPPPRAETPASPPQAETPAPAPQAQAPPPEGQQTDISAELDRIIGKDPG
jgi:hypothetical protein